MANALVGIVLGSKNDAEKVKKAQEILDNYGIAWEINFLSAHRTPNKAAEYAKSARGRGLKCIIAGAGLAAALPGVIAAHTTLPVIGLPVCAGPLNGLDALYSIVQMPPGIPVACVGIDNSANAAHLAAQIVSASVPEVVKKIEEFRAGFGDS
ncbi:MAG: 5-(carboxyamino)imidazole ribonucleotide mutase [Fibrobacteres bacterium]|nr:5-(carboxyamino)imidazole ribonucleotide mutase [Fibrobacterota bacterium]